MENTTIDTIYESVVRIETNIISFNWLAPFVKSKSGIGSGTGFIIDELGYILTCFHVINQAVHIFVTMPKSGKQRIPAKIIAIYPEMDIAVIKINIKEKTKFLKLGNSDNIKIGKEVIAIGYPLGQDKLSVTKGIVSGIQNDYIQTDASINPGNSGGPLLYKDTVIGINTAKIVSEDTEGVGFANPINNFNNVRKRMFSNKSTPISGSNSSIVSYIKNDIVRIQASSLGILTDKCTKEMLEYYFCDCSSGIQMTTVFDSSPLKTGVHPAKDGDILCSIENYDIDNNGECLVPWNREKVSYENVFDRLSHTQNNITVTYYTILENKSIQDAGLIFSLQDLLKSVISTPKKYNTYKSLGVKVTKTVPIVPASKIFKIWNFYPPYDDIQYVAFGGLVFMNLSMNHIMIKGLQHLFYNFVGKLDKSVVLITKILPSSVQIDGILSEGDIISEINDQPIKTLEDVQKALSYPIKKIKRSTKSKCFFTVRTTLNKFYSIGLFKIVMEDIKLFQYINYTPSEATKYFIKDIQNGVTDSCLQNGKDDLKNSNNTNSNVFNIE